MRRAAKVDANQDQIVQALKAAGATVQSLAPIGHGCPDILCGFRGANLLMEIKNPDGRDRVEKDQTRWHIEWNAPVHVVRTPDDALRALGVLA
jgi:hypothetical protein